MFHEQTYSAVPPVMLIAMIAWLIVLFTAFGLLPRKNAKVIAALGTSALSVTAAIFLIVAMNHPYAELMRLSSAPLQEVLTQLKQ